ncbi:hypothetical protein H4R34_001936 [Dimargaris verticillata]|uniref:SRP9 domain-containing protein n=1 Tax=Dimargaris verticillata TaxID=2761393 RepID=A0A9W8B3H7_9FUNG|nr:hypothetical protein H4R34_001936 [Dimargaris verticillata]
MTRYQSWPDFRAAVDELYTAAPFKTRYVTKLRPGDGAIVVRATNDIVSCSYQATSLDDLGRIEQLNHVIAQRAHNRAFALKAREPRASTKPAANSSSSKPNTAPSGKQSKKGASSNNAGKKKSKRR